MRVPKVDLIPLAVLIAIFAAPIAIIIPNVLGLAVIGWAPPPWWEIMQIWFLPGFISISTLKFFPCWTLLQFASDPTQPSYPIFASIAISDTLAYMTLSLSWLVVGLVLYVNVQIFSHKRLAFLPALVFTISMFLVEFILPYLILFNLFNVVMWSIAAIIPLPFPSIIACLGIIRKHLQMTSPSDK